MRILWIIIVIIFAGGIATAIISDDDTGARSSIDSGENSGGIERPGTLDIQPGMQSDQIQTQEGLAKDLTVASTAGEPPTDPMPPPAGSVKRTAGDGLSGQGEAISIGMERTIPSATVLKGNIRRVAPDELDVDGEFTLEGEGTEQNPYRPSWEYLYSAGDTYAPRLGKNEIPQRIALLDGAWIEISGYTVFPLVSGKTTELLVMLNQWDGCCIGVPPTPYDAIEVGLNDAVMRGPKHSLSVGTITGRLKVDPYLIEDWLVGLYLLEEAKLEVGI